MNLKNIFIIGLNLILIVSASAQMTSAQVSPLPQELSLEKAIEIAMQGNPGLQVKSLQVELARKRIEEAEWKKIPALYLDYNLRRNLILPTTPVPAIAFDPNATKGEIIPLQFSSKWTSNIGIVGHYDIFNPQRNGKEEVASRKAGIKQTEKMIETNKLKSQVRQDYAACIIARAQLELAITDTSNTAELARITRNLYAAGRIKITDLNLVLSEKIQAQNHYLKARKIYHSTRAQLLLDMGFSPISDLSFTLTDNITELVKKYKNDGKLNDSSLSLQKLQQEQNLLTLQIENAQKGFLPTVSLQAYLGANYYANSINILNIENWYGNSYLGLEVTVPITQGLDRIKNIEALNIQRRISDARYNIQESQLELEKRNAREDLAYKHDVLQLSNEKMMNMKENWQAAQDQYQQGRLLTEDILSSSYNYRAAQTEYLKAAYEFLIAQIEMKRLRRR